MLVFLLETKQSARLACYGPRTAGIQHLGRRGRRGSWNVGLRRWLQVGGGFCTITGLTMEKLGKFGR